eukprot:4362119-Pleurochrysis_carterae.AAC.1
MLKYSNVKRLHNKQLQETEHGALGIIWGRHKGDLMATQEKMEQRSRVVGVREKRKTAECWGGEEYLIEREDGEQNWVNKLEVQNMNGVEAVLIHRERELITESTTTFAEHMIDYGLDMQQRTWNDTWKEFLKYAQTGDRGGSVKENARINERRRETNPREPHPTLYPGEVEGDKECKEHGHQRRNMRELTNRAKANQ